MGRRDRISLKNQWKIIECASFGNGPPGTHFVVKPMGNHRNDKPGFRQRLRNFDAKPLPNQRNEENRKSNTMVQFRWKNVTKSTKWGETTNKQDEADFVEKPMGNHRNHIVREATMRTEIRCKTIRICIELAKSRGQQNPARDLPHFDAKPLSNHRNQNRPAAGLSAPKNWFLGGSLKIAWDEISI